MFGIGKGRLGDKQDVLLLTAKGDAVEARMDVLPDCIIDYKELMAWDLDYNQQYIDEYTGKSVQVISELDYSPLKIFPNRPSKPSDPINDLFKRKVKEALSQINEHKKKTNITLWLGIVLLLFAIVITALIFIGITRGDSEPLTPTIGGLLQCLVLI